MKKQLIFVGLMMFIILIGCSKNDGKTQDKESKEGVHESGEPSSATVFPLTGIETDGNIDHRAVSVMINNHSAARPQSGLSQADIVFEVLAEGGITRFLALYQSEVPEVVGPVRSAREYYFELAAGYDALYVFHGAANFVYDLISDREIDNLNGATYDNDGYLFKRESFRKAPHNSYLQYNAVYDEAESQGYDIISTIEPLPFLKDDETIDGDSADHVEISYPGRDATDVVEFSYDEQSEKYTRYENQDKTIELNSEEPIQVDNVFIVEAYHEVFDKEGRRTIDLEAGGDAYLIQKGKVQKLEWKNENGVIIPVKDGQHIGFSKGKTWINVVPSDPGIDQSIIITGK